MTDKETTDSSKSYKHTLETRQKISNFSKGHIPWNKGKKGLQTAWNNGIPLTDEARQKMSESLKGKTSPMKGKKHSIEARKKMSITRKGRTPWNKGKKGVQTAWNKGISSSLETCQKISKANTGNIPWNKGKKGVQIGWNKGTLQTLETRQKISSSLLANPLIKGVPKSSKTKQKMSLSAIKNICKLDHSSNSKWINKNTRPELAIQKILFDNDIFFIHQCHVDDIEHQYVADFYLPDHNCVVEADGTYWHNYPIGNEIDHIRTAEMKAKGYNVLRFWDGQIEEQDVLSKIQGLN